MLSGAQELPTYGLRVTALLPEEMWVLCSALWGRVWFYPSSQTALVLRHRREKGTTHLPTPPTVMATVMAAPPEGYSMCNLARMKDSRSRGRMEDSHSRAIRDD